MEYRKRGKNGQWNDYSDNIIRVFDDYKNNHGIFG